MLFPEPPGIQLRRCRAGQRVKLVALVGDKHGRNPRRNPRWVIQPAVLIVGRFSTETVLLHDQEAWLRSKAEQAMCPVAAEVDKDARCVPVGS